MRCPSARWRCPGTGCWWEAACRSTASCRMIRGCFSASPAISQERSRQTPTWLLRVRPLEEISKLSARLLLNSAHLPVSVPSLFLFLKSAPLFAFSNPLFSLSLSVLPPTPPSIYISPRIDRIVTLDARAIIGYFWTCSRKRRDRKRKREREREREGGDGDLPCHILWAVPENETWQPSLLSSLLSSQLSSALLGPKLFISLIITFISLDLIEHVCVCVSVCVWLTPPPSQVSLQTSRLARLTAPWLTACQSSCIARPREPRGPPSPGRKVRGLTAWGCERERLIMLDLSNLEKRLENMHFLQTRFLTSLHCFPLLFVSLDMFPIP